MAVLLITADIGAFFAITNKMGFRNKYVLEFQTGVIGERAVSGVAKRLQRLDSGGSIVAVVDRCMG